MGPGAQFTKCRGLGDFVNGLVYIQGNRIAEYEVGGTAGPQLLREYIWHDGVPIAVVENGQTYYIRTDHIGRPVFATDSTGAKVWEVSYLPFGSVHQMVSDAADLRFPGSRGLCQTAAAQWASGSRPRVVSTGAFARERLKPSTGGFPGRRSPRTGCATTTRPPDDIFRPTPSA